MNIFPRGAEALQVTGLLVAFCVSASAVTLNPPSSGTQTVDYARVAATENHVPSTDHKLLPVYILPSIPMKTQMQLRGSLTVRAKSWEDAIRMLVQGAREMHANGLISPRYKKGGTSDNDFVEVLAEVVNFRYPEQLLLSGSKYFVR